MPIEKSHEHFVHIEGLRQLRRLIRPPSNLLAKPWHNAMTDLKEAGERVARRHAPVRTGYLLSKIKSAIQKKAMPMWAAIRVRARRRSHGYPRGFEYPRLLEYSPKHGHKGWFNPPIRSLWGSRARLALTKAGKEIARRWRRGY